VPSKTTRLEHLLEAVPDALVGMDQKGVIRFVNRQTEMLFGYDRDQLIGRPVETLVPESLYEIYAEHREDYFTDPRTRSSGLDLELTARTRDRAELPVNVSMSGIDTGDVLLVIRAERDVTTQRQAVEGAQLTAAIVEFSDDAIIGSTLEGVVTSWNPAAERVYGYPSGEIIGRYAGRLSPRDRAGELKDSLARLKADQPVERLETVRVRRDGTEFPASITMAPIRDDGGAVVGASVICRDVTEQRRALEAAQRMAAIVEFSDDAILGGTLEGVITSWNPAAARMFGYSGAEIIGRSIALLVPEEQAGDFANVMAEVGAGRHVERLETFNVRRDGTVFPISLTVSPIREGDEVVGASAICRDITEQKKAFETAQWMAAIVQGSTDAVIGRTLQGTITSWNPAAERTYGYSGEEIIGRPASVLVPEGQTDDVDAILASIIAGQRVEHRAITHVRKDGTQFPVALTVSPIRDADGAVVGVSTISRDMTEQVLAIEAAQRVEAIVQSSGDAIISLTLDGVITHWNPAAEELYGYSASEVVGRSLGFLLPEDRRGELSAVISWIRDGQVIQDSLYSELPRKDGTLVPISITIAPIRDSGGDVVGVVSTSHDATEQRQAFEAAQRMAAIVEGSRDAIISGSLDGIITSWNPAAEALYGYSGDEIVGKSISLLIPGDRTRDIAAILDRMNQGQAVKDFETMRVRRDGTEFPVSLTISPIRDAGGAIVGTSAIHHDMTAYVRRLEIAQRLAAIVESSEDAIIGGTLDGLVASWNPAAEAMFGYSSEEILGKPVSLLAPPDEAGVVKANVAKIGAGQPVERHEVQRVRKDGTLFPVLHTVSPIRGEHGAVVGVSAICRDMTEQEHAAQYARSLVEAALDPLVMIGLDGSISDLNEAAVKIIGLARDELTGSDFTRYVTEPDKAGEVLQRVLTQGWVANAPLTVRHSNGTLTRALCNASAYRDSTGNVLGMLVIARDVTEHMLRDEEVQGLASMIEFIDEAVIGTTLDGIVTSWNPAAARMHGYSAEEVVGRSIRLVIPDDRRDEAGVILARINEGQTVRGLQTVRLRKDGTMFRVSITVGPIRDSGGTIVGSTAISRELT